MKINFFYILLGFIVSMTTVSCRNEFTSTEPTEESELKQNFLVRRDSVINIANEPDPPKDRDNWKVGSSH